MNDKEMHIKQHHKLASPLSPLKHALVLLKGSLDDKQLCEKLIDEMCDRCDLVKDRIDCLFDNFTLTQKRVGTTNGGKYEKEI